MIKCGFVAHTPGVAQVLCYCGICSNCRFVLMLFPIFDLWPSQWGYIRIRGGSREGSGSRTESIWCRCITWRSDHQGPWSGQRSEADVAVPATGEEGEKPGSQGLPMFLRLSSSLPQWSCLILLQFCSNSVSTATHVQAEFSPIHPMLME